MLDRENRNGNRHMAAGVRLAIVAGLTIAGAGVGIMNPLQAQAAQETRVFTWRNGETQPSVPQTITVNGEELKLKNTSQPKQSGVSNASSQVFNKSIDMTVAKDQKDAIPSLVPATTHVSEGGYDGDIPRTKIDYTPIYVPQTKVDSMTKEFVYGKTKDNNPPDNNTAKIDSSIISNKTSKPLPLVRVDWTKEHVMSDGTVDYWKGIAHYETTYSSNELDHFNVTAYYSGTLTRGASTGDWSMTATYESEPAASSSQPNSGVTATFEDLDSFDGNASDSNENENEDEYTGSTKKDKDVKADSSASENSSPAKGFSIPVVPIAAGVGGLAVVGIIAAIVAKSKKRGGKKKKKQKNANASAGDQMACELIEYYDDGYTDDNQRKIATLQGVLSNEANAPTIVWCPDASQIPESMWEDKAENGPWEIVDDGDGERIEFSPNEKFDYYIVISKIADAVSDRLLVVSANETVIYDGEIAENVQLDPVALADGVNGDTSDPDIRYLGDLLAEEGLHVPGEGDDDDGFGGLDDLGSTGGFDAIDDGSLDGFGGVSYDQAGDDLDASGTFEPLVGFDDGTGHDTSLDNDFPSGVGGDTHDDSLDGYFDADGHDDSLDREDPAPHPDDIDDGFSFDVDDDY